MRQQRSRAGTPNPRAGRTARSGPGPSRAEQPDIPVMIDDVKDLEGFDMTRFIFFTINAGETFQDWVDLRLNPETPFLVLGDVPVIYRPHRDQQLFRSAQQIDLLFDRIEAAAGLNLLIEIEQLWLPNQVLDPKYAERKSAARDNPELWRAAVWRLPLAWFQLALQFERELISQADFAQRCDLLLQSGDLPRYSAEETRAFQQWSQDQIAAARENYRRQRADPRLGVLNWRNESGQEQPG